MIRHSDAIVWPAPLPIVYFAVMHDSRTISDDRPWTRGQHSSPLAALCQDGFAKETAVLPTFGFSGKSSIRNSMMIRRAYEDR